MPVLPNNKHELFAQGLAKGLSADAAYEQASYRPNRGNAARLKANESISGRVKELQEAAAAEAMVTKQWVLDRLMVVERAMAAMPVLDGDGNPTGEYSFQASSAIRALELIGKELGMFTGRREDEVSVLHMAVDRPPRETREQWLARISRERGLPAPTMWILQPGTRAMTVSGRRREDGARPNASHPADGNDCAGCHLVLSAAMIGA
jgi:hypothetical protein